MKSVALQFGTASEVVASTVPGARNSHEAKENAEMIGITIPDDLWDELKSNNLIPADCQVP